MWALNWRPSAHTDCTRGVAPCPSTPPGHSRCVRRVPVHGVAAAGSGSGSGWLPRWNSRLLAERAEASALWAASHPGLGAASLPGGPFAGSGGGLQARAEASALSAGAHAASHQGLVAASLRGASGGGLRARAEASAPSSELQLQLVAAWPPSAASQAQAEGEAGSALVALRHRAMGCGWAAVAESALGRQRPLPRRRSWAWPCARESEAELVRLADAATYRCPAGGSSAHVGICPGSAGSGSDLGVPRIAYLEDAGSGSSPWCTRSSGCKPGRSCADRHAPTGSR